MITDRLLTIKCPVHDRAVVTVNIRMHEIRSGYRQIVRAILALGTAKCPVYDCPYVVEFDASNGVVISEKKP